jgi:ketosteroid isomerase-like protein
MDTPSSNPHKARMQTIMDALARGDRRPFGQALADDFTWIVPGTNAWSGRYQGLQAVRERLFGPLFAQFVDTYTNTPMRLIAEGDLVVVECRGRVTTRRGLPYHNSYCLVCRFGPDGLLHELVEYMDTQMVADVLEPPERVTAAS